MNPHARDARKVGESLARGAPKARAYAELKELVVTGHLRPGDFITVRQMSARLNRSATPVRLAFQRLEAEGFITIGPLGTRIAAPSEHEIADQIEVRIALESYTLRTLAGRRTPDQVAGVRANLRAQAQLRGSGDVAKGMELDAAFHVQFAEFLGNGEILRVIVRLREKMQRVITQVFRLCPSRIDTSYDEHAAIAAAVIGGDGERAAELLVRHLELGKRLILSPRG